MPQLIKDRAVVADPWTLVRETGAPDTVPATGAVIVPLAAWAAHREAFTVRGNVGVWLAPADEPGALAADIATLPLIAVDFPQFTDGRGYSTARLLRDRFGFTGELRAIGDVQRDQLYYLAQCGFNAFELRDGRSADDALAGLTVFSDGYQLTHARVPWFRRRDTAADRGGFRFPCE
jgi:uncharacterized protein (DUF934 family)